MYHVSESILRQNLLFILPRLKIFFLDNFIFLFIEGRIMFILCFFSCDTKRSTWVHRTNTLFMQTKQINIPSILRHLSSCHNKPFLRWYDPDKWYKLHRGFSCWHHFSKFLSNLYFSFLLKDFKRFWKFLKTMTVESDSRYHSLICIYETFWAKRKK